MTTPASPTILTSHGKTNYGSIHPTSGPHVDVEETIPLMVEFDTAEQYPEASGEQQQVLNILDKTIWEMKDGGDVTLRITPLTAEEVQASWKDKNPAVLDPSFSGCLCRSILGVPLITFGVTVALCVGAMYYCANGFASGVISITDFLRFVLPGMVAILALCGASIPIRSRLWGFAKVVGYYNQPEMVHKVATEAIDEQIVLYVANKVDSINMSLNLLGDSMTSQVKMSPVDRERYLKVDPTLPEMPTNPSDYIEQDLRGAKNELQASVLYFFQDDALKVEQWIPKRFTSPKAYYSRAVAGNLFVIFFFQCVVAYGTYWLVTLYYPIVTEGAGSIVEEAMDEIDHIANKFIPFSLHDIVTTQVLVWICALSFEAYLYSCCVVVIISTKTTSVERMVHITNQILEKVSVETTTLLRQHGIIFLCRDILELRTERTKMKLLTLIRNAYRLEMIRGIVDGDSGINSVTVPTAPLTPSTPSGKGTSSFFLFGVPSSPSTSSTTDLSKKSSPMSAGSVTTTKPIETSPPLNRSSVSERWKSTLGSWRRGGPSNTQTSTTKDTDKDDAINGTTPDDEEKKLPAQ